MKFAFAMLAATALAGYQLAPEEQYAIEDFTTLGMTHMDQAQLVAGLLYGIIDGEDCEHIELCFSDLHLEADMVVDALSLIFEPNLWHPKDFTEGILELSEAAAHVPRTIFDCAESIGDGIKLAEWIDNLIQQDVLKDYIKHNVERHIVQLSNDSRKARKEFKHQEYFQCGFTLGEMVTIATQ